MSGGETLGNHGATIDPAGAWGMPKFSVLVRSLGWRRGIVCGMRVPCVGKDVLVRLSAKTRLSDAQSSHTGPIDVNGVSSSTFSITDLEGSGSGARIRVGPGILQRNHFACNQESRTQARISLNITRIIRVLRRVQHVDIPRAAGKKPLDKSA